MGMVWDIFMARNINMPILRGEKQCRQLNLEFSGKNLNSTFDFRFQRQN